MSLTHDPRQLIEDIRDHLAAHDRRISFLFGAGTSSAVNVAAPSSGGAKRRHEPLIPGVDGLTAICGSSVTAMGEIQTAAWGKLIQQCEVTCRRSNVENLLSLVRMKIDAIGENETLAGLDRSQLLGIEKTICTTIAQTVTPAEDIIPRHTPHEAFASWARKVNRTVPLEVFTTNYDVLFERAFEASRVPVFDGFVGTLRPFFYSECLDDESLLPKASWIRLWKLHGSVNWRLHDEAGGKKRIIRGEPTTSGEMILPSHRKYDQSRKQPYIAYMDRLSRILGRDHALLIVCGYSFGDEHINAILYGALDNRPTANVIAFQYEDLKKTDEIYATAKRRSNLTAIGPNGAVISGVWGAWQLGQPVDGKTCSFMDTAFDSYASVEDEGSPAAISPDLEGRMRLGDFNWFCRFLDEMGPVTR